MNLGVLESVYKRKSVILPIVFVAVFLVDISYSFYRLMNVSAAGGDSQWYGAKLFWSGVNPYTACLESSEWFLTAYPNYAHFLYIALFPISFMEWETAKASWFLLNVLGFLWVLYLFVKKEGISRDKVLFVSILLLLGSTFTNALYQAQMSGIIMILLSLAWIYRKKWMVLSLLLALIFTKYSFGLPLLFGFFLAGYYKETITAFAINMLSVLVFAISFDMGFLETLVQPFQVASRFTEFGHSDVISLFRTTHTGENIFGLNYFSITVATVYLVYSYLWLRYQFHEKAIIVSSILLSFSMFFHLDYDYSVLLAAILIALAPLSLSARSLRFLIGLSAYFWLYPMIPKLLRTFLKMDTGLLPVEWFGRTYGILFIGLNTLMITVVAFLVLFDKNLKPKLRSIALKK